MGIEHTYDRVNGLFRVKFTGEISKEALLDSTLGMIAHPDWQTGKPRLNLFRRGADLSTITFEDLQSIWARLKPVLERTGSMPHRSAWVVKEPSARPLIELWGVTPGVDTYALIRIFDTESEALSWLASPLQAAGLCDSSTAF